MERLLHFPGQRGNSNKYFLRGHIFHRDISRRMKVPTFRCADREWSGCKMKLKGTNADPTNVTIFGDHNGCKDPDFLYPEKMQFRETVCHIAGSCSRSLKGIFDKEIDRDNE